MVHHTIKRLRHWPVSQKFILMGLMALLLTIVGGIFSALFYIPALYPALRQSGLEMPQAHSVHTAFAMAWIFIIPVGIIYSMLEDSVGGIRAGEQKLAHVQLALWTVAGAGILVSLLAGVYSGREYMEYHTFFSVLIFIGWALLAKIFISRVYSDFWASPVYIHMWAVGTLLFMYVYAESNLWFFGFFKGQPVTDIQVQWKSIGTLLGAMNLNVYGAALYISERITKDKTYAQSNMAFSLFWIGLLSSFTNYAHHTYHLPQDEFIKWISFVSSMIEVVILVKVLYDISDLIRKKVYFHHKPSDPEKFAESLFYLNSSKIWTLLNLVLAITISIPPINTLVHGTYVVVAHSMGAMIGIDGFIVFAATAWFIEKQELREHDHRSSKPVYRLPTFILHLGLAFMVTSLIYGGAMTGLYKYTGEVAPSWVMQARLVFPLSGMIIAVAINILLYRWIRKLGKV